MGKETKELWVVEVRRAYGTGQQPGNWWSVERGSRAWHTARSISGKNSVTIWNVGRSMSAV